jgi:amino acid transporter
MHRKSPGLRRVVRLGPLVLYGVGTMVGAGIYALVGAVAGAAGALAPLSFVVAATLAATTAASFAELAARIPSAGGSAAYVQTAFDDERLGRLVGALFVAASVVSAGVLFGAFAGYAASLGALPRPVVLLALAAVLGLVAVWGIAQSVAVIAVIAVLEAGALVVIVGAGLLHGSGPPAAAPEAAPGPAGVVSGAVLAFYAFIGFEDMVTTAEEVREPRRTVPLALAAALGVATLLYAGTAHVAVSALPAGALAGSEAPMALLFETVTPWPEEILSVIALFAIANGALVQILAATRVLVGLGELGTLPRWLARVHPRTRTPVTLTAAIVATVLLVTLLLPLEDLARITTCLLLLVFTLVNLALLRLRRDPDAPRPPFRIPAVVPWLGAASSALFALQSLRDLPSS